MATYDLKRMKELLLAGRTNLQIANELGVTIGTVAGRRYRLKKAIEEGRRLRKIPKPFAEASSVLVVKMAVRCKKHHGPRNVDILGLKRGYCRWPKDNGLYCAANVVEGHPYCHDHCKQAYPVYALKHPESLNDRR